MTPRLLSATTAILLITISAQALTVQIQVTDAMCGQNGCASAVASGGVPPYTCLWGGGETTASIYEVPPGPVSVTVTDFEGTQAVDNGTVQAGGFTEYFATDAYCSQPFYFHAVSGLFVEFPHCQTWISVYNPVELNGTPDPILTDELYGEQLFITGLVGAQPGTNIPITVDDGNGCTGTIHLGIGWPLEFPPITVLDVEGACSGGDNGSVLISYPAEAHLQGTSLYMRPVGGPIGQVKNLSGAGGTALITDLLPGDYWIRQFDYPLIHEAGTNFCGDSILVSVPDLGNTCGNVSGTVYMDYDTDCTFNFSEPREPGAILTFQPGPYYATANNLGQYSINLATGSYTVEHVAVNVAQHCPAPPAAVEVNGNQFLDIADTSLVPLDVSAAISSGPARPGFELHYALAVLNHTPASSGNTSTVMTFDPAVSFIGATPAPSNVSGTTLTWDQGALNAFEQRGIQVRLQVPSDIALIGTVLSASVNVSTVNTDAVPVNNGASTSVTVTASYDPNEKVAATSSGESNALYYIDADEWIDYTIRFQNTGTDTAFNVIVTDTLPVTLDPASIEWGASSQPCLRAVTGQGTLKFIFANTLLPDSGANEAASHGIVSFRIRPRLPLVPGTIITNTANIFFDFNPAVITAPSILTAEFSTSIVEVGISSLLLSPVPATDQLRVSAERTIDAIIILAADGREVMRAPVRASNASLDIVGLRTGPYVLIAQLNNGSVARERFIKH